MTGAARASAARIVAVALAAALLIGGQAAGDATAGSDRVSAAGAVGRAGFAYLAGIRTFAAAVLWARLDPINDTYYGASLENQRFLLPPIRMVTLLDPRMEEPYYIGPWLLWETGRKDVAGQLAREGIANNPDSAFLHAGYAQLLLAEGRVADAAREADAAMRGKWPSLADEYEALPTLEIAFDKSGRRDRGDAVRAERARLEEIARSDPNALKHPGE